MTAITKEEQITDDEINQWIDEMRDDSDEEKYSRKDDAKKSNKQKVNAQVEQ